jgi:hypothetical protein
VRGEPRQGERHPLAGGYRKVSDGLEVFAAQLDRRLEAQGVGAAHRDDAVVVAPHPGDQ